MKASLIELGLHKSVQEKNDTALSRLNYMYGDQIVRILKYKFQTAATRDEAYIMEAVNEALFGYYKNPNAFNPEKLTLLSFLIVAAKRDLLNILQKEKKHLNRKNLPEDVELQEKFWNSVMEGQSSPDDTIQYDEKMTTIQNLLEGLFENKRDVILAEMIIGADRETELYIEVLEITELTVDEQRIEVKKNKDRIKQVLKRNDVENKIKNLLR